MNWPMAAVLIAIICAIMVIASTYVARPKKLPCHGDGTCASVITSGKGCRWPLGPARWRYRGGMSAASRRVTDTTRC